MELKFELRHKVSEGGYCISEIKIEGTETLDNGVEFRTRVYIDLDLVEEELNFEERITKEVEYVKKVLKEKAENFKNNLQRLKGMLSTVGGAIEEEVVYI